METALTLWGRPDFFTVKSNGGTDVAAKWLKNPSGGYIIDPITDKPYIVPANYDPLNTINKYSLVAENANRSGIGIDKILKATELVNGFAPGWPGSVDDLQRSYNGYIGQKNGGVAGGRSDADFVSDFRDAASFNVGLACAAVGASQSDCLAGGGIAKIAASIMNLRNQLGSVTDFLNPADNAANIRTGFDAFSTTGFGPITVAPLTPPSPALQTEIANPTRQSSNYVTTGEPNSLVVRPGGWLSDVLAEANRGKPADQRLTLADLQANNIEIRDVNVISAGQQILIPTRVGSILTLNYTNGATVVNTPDYRVRSPISQNNIN
jgi:hypothetical protein